MTTRTGHREVIGERLKAFRENRGVSLHSLASAGGITIEQAEAVESGNSDYSIDVFISYIIGSGLYIYFAEKSADRCQPHDIDDLAHKAIDADPKL